MCNLFPAASSNRQRMKALLQDDKYEGDARYRSPEERWCTRRLPEACFTRNHPGTTGHFTTLEEG